MTIKTTTSHTVTFKVEAFWDEEGGMGHGEFGSVCQDLQSAIHLLCVARAQEPDTDWIITADVKTTTQ